LSDYTFKLYALTVRLSYQDNETTEQCEIQRNALCKIWQERRCQRQDSQKLRIYSWRKQMVFFYITVQSRILYKFEEYHMQYFLRNHCVENSLNCIPFIIYEYVRSPKEQHKYTMHYLGRSYYIPEYTALSDEKNALIVIKKLIPKAIQFLAISLENWWIFTVRE
jgi:hypothetical protein